MRDQENLGLDIPTYLVVVKDLVISALFCKWKPCFVSMNGNILHTLLTPKIDLIRGTRKSWSRQ